MLEYKDITWIRYKVRRDYVVYLSVDKRFKLVIRYNGLDSQFRIYKNK
jgi:hypothetical protein